MGFSERLLLVCEVPGPGKAARGSEGGTGGAAPPGFIGPKIPLHVEGPLMAMGTHVNLCLVRSYVHTFTFSAFTHCMQHDIRFVLCSVMKKSQPKIV